MQAINPNGSGPALAQSNAVTPTGPAKPSAPTGVQAQPASTSARVTWTAADSNGDSPITSQTITPYIGSTAQTPVQVGASATSAIVTGLTNGAAYTFKLAATNGVGTGPASAASDPVTPQSTIFDFATPNGSDSAGDPPVELGVKFTASYNGSVTGIRFYKGAGNTGTHVGNLWTASGTRLAQATFTNETSSGWQAVTFATPVSVTANTTYVASYFSPAGAYTAASNGLASQIDNGPLHTVPNSTSTNGVYAYGATSTFPSSSYNAANYFVDVLYALPLPGQVTNVTASAAGTASANVSWSAPSSGGPVTSYRVTPYVGSTAQTPKTVAASNTATTVTGLTTGTTYTFKVEALNANGPGPASAASNTVTPTGPVVPSAPTSVVARPATASARVTWTLPSGDGDSAITGQTITPYIGSTAQTPMQVGASATSATMTGLTNDTTYTFKVTATNGIGTSPASAASNAVTPEATVFDFATPATIDSGDVLPVELGVKFKADFNGAVTGIRFYKAAGNTGTHIGSLWTASGTRLAQATFTNETDSGWQAVTFSSPVTITPGTTYIASYFSPNGHYSATNAGLASAIDNGLLHTIASSASPNGVYMYGPASVFPANTYESANYFVDVLFAPASVPGTPTGVTATAGNAAASVSWTAPSSGGPVSSYTVTPFIGSSAQTPRTVNAPATSTTMTGLTPGQSYTFTVRATNPSGSGQASAPSNAVTPTGSVAPGAPTSVTAVADSKAAIVGWTAPANDGGASISGYTVTPFIGATAQTPVQVSGSATSARITGLSNDTDYTFTVKATNAAGTGPASSASGTVTPRASLMESGTPVTVDSGDPGSVVLGTKFTSDVAGTVTGLRFYKAATNTGTHVGGLWSLDGTPLAQASFTTETGSGWQAVTFSSPAAITANTTYVVGYLAPNGHYSVSSGAFGNPFDNPPLHALANAASANGVYRYTASLAFPASAFNATNYWVDVLFAPGS